MSGNFLRKNRALIITALALVLALIIIFQIISNNKFHVVGTTPATNKVSTLTPFLGVNFNKPLPSQNLTITSTDNEVGGYHIADKTLTLDLNYSSSTYNKTYTIRIAGIYDSKRSELKNLVISYTPQNIPLQDLPVNQQKFILKNQQPKNKVSFTGTSALINNGLSVTQVSLLEQYILKFKPSARSVIISPNNVGIYAGTPPAIAMVKFSVSIDGTTYSAEGSYTFINNIDLSLYDPSTGALVFDSSN